MQDLIIQLLKKLLRYILVFMSLWLIVFFLSFSIDALVEISSEPAGNGAGILTFVLTMIVSQTLCAPWFDYMYQGHENVYIIFLLATASYFINVFIVSLLLTILKYRKHLTSN
ncbi:hypothetical protein CWB72_12000 [Pseudoalteromonas phenolica]|uniref:hypothetical protein n=1 Tax=Pseudoalteromonas phenolica TaxID=161398 RepID=UPI00126D8528|nr:hypothetical protein [Pseudoalteromonas phenolica]TMN88888.1 hypothetical protein CWB72_12000 [Pseudoalteromonas phenolica]